MEIVWHNGTGLTKLNLVVYKNICTTKRFVINGVQADLSDFGKLKDLAPDPENPYRCGDMRFIPHPLIRKTTYKARRKYKISLKDYGRIAELLMDKLSFGKCEYCE